MHFNNPMDIDISFAFFSKEGKNAARVANLFRARRDEKNRRFVSWAKRPIGAHGAGETPVLIPNTAVKPSSGDYTALAGN